MARTKEVLFLCKRNSTRSQMAEAVLRARGGESFRVHSAGLRPAPIHPLTWKVMDEIGVSMAGQRSKSAREFLGRLSVEYLIILSDPADQDSPRLFPGMRHRMFWPFEDPALVAGSEEMQSEAFRRVRDQISERIGRWLAVLEIGKAPSSPLSPVRHNRVTIP